MTFEIKSLDANTSIQDQLDSKAAGEVTFVAVHQVQADDIPAFLKAWDNEGPFLISQPGFISRELTRALGKDTTTLVDYTKFSSVQALRDALFHPEHQALIAPYQQLSGISLQNVFTAV